MGLIQVCRRRRKKWRKRWAVSKESLQVLRGIRLCRELWLISGNHQQHFNTPWKQQPPETALRPFWILSCLSPSDVRKHILQHDCSASQVLWLYSAQDMAGGILLYQSPSYSHSFCAQETSGGRTNGGRKQWIQRVTNSDVLIKHTLSTHPPLLSPVFLLRFYQFRLWLHCIFSASNTIFHSFHIPIFNIPVATKCCQFYSEMSLKTDLPFAALQLLPFNKLLPSLTQITATASCGSACLKSLPFSRIAFTLPPVKPHKTDLIMLFSVRNSQWFPTADKIKYKILDLAFEVFPIKL